MGVAHGRRRGAAQDCNWLQVVENNLDQAHVFILHQDRRVGPSRSANTTRGLIDKLESARILAKATVRHQAHARCRKDGYVETDLLIFPQTRGC